ncbi:MAG: glycosyltransferase [Chloroflexota bacterium]|nr:glycosyltransferase [Chloroflexota bacterium]
MIRPLLVTLTVVQAALGARVVWRLVRTARGSRISAAADIETGERVAVIVPVLNERSRLGPCLEGLIAQGEEVVQILVVDGGSTDGTPDLVRNYAARDHRIRLIDASSVPDGWNGKAHGLQIGLEQAPPDAAWILTIDADVRPAPLLACSLLAHAQAKQVPALSAATLQELSGAAEGLVHPALLATLVYRFGIPGRATARLSEVQANGQCFLVRRDVLERGGGFQSVRDSLCEDVTLARRIATMGHPVGFFETDGLVSVAMYAGWHDAWRNWSRSLPMRDRYWGAAGPLGLAEVALVQALPLALTPLLLPIRADRVGGAAYVINAALAAVRLGTLAGMARAYRHQPWTYWLSPLADLPVAAQLLASAVRREHRWRGRPIVRGGTR